MADKTAANRIPDELVANVRRYHHLIDGLAHSFDLAEGSRRVRRWVAGMARGRPIVSFRGPRRERPQDTKDEGDREPVELASHPDSPKRPTRHVAAS